MSDPRTMTTETWRGRIPLMVAHCAGMLDLAALPVWVGTLISDYHFEPRQAGGLATLFLLGAVTSSLLFSARFHRMNVRFAVILGFGGAAAAFGIASQTADYGVLALLHLIAGASASFGLSATHGTIARSRNPHRLFAMVGAALGIFAILFLGGTRELIAGFGGKTLFLVFSGVMAAAAITALISFPSARAKSVQPQGVKEKVPAAVWFGAIGISCMALIQAMVFSFLERIGADRGFSPGTITAVLIVLGFVNLAPAPLAGLLENKVPARRVMMAGPLLQLALTLTLTFGHGFIAYCGPAVVFAAVMIFTHTFAFGVLARLDPSSRVLAATPAMLMIGAAIGPVAGGFLVQSFGYPAIGAASAVISLVATLLFSRIGVSGGRRAAQQPV